ncbi:replication-relaxation family protein [Nocardiopsis dassonvillei]|uniref:replication-relaxation family protein n=1 Tax=Nocardiopsis dassonvillei TaxID=2014 RepID=UPI00200F7DA7|nr:replication-relaxation family protein [Nocardiopsis dassonvillei]MCK9871346.1 replication-relaxation family protein [Nocardiopsis dassonvillei]
MSLGTVASVERDLLLVLYQHRLATTLQLQRLVTPHTPNRQYVWRVLDRLRRNGLADRVTGRADQPYTWYLTTPGVHAVEQDDVIVARPYRMNRRKALGPLQRHVLAVTEVGTLFFEDARRRGDSFGPLSWTPEIAHRFQQGEGDTHVISDALMHYTRVHPSGARTQIQSFLELDRASMPVHRLASKLVSYARYYDYRPMPQVPGKRRSPATLRAGVPAWSKRYPRFPRVLVVLDGVRPELQDARRADLAAYVEHIPYLVEPRSGFMIGCCTMHELSTHGPNAAIWTNLLTTDAAVTDFRLKPSHA